MRLEGIHHITDDHRATRPATSTSTRACSGCAWSPRPSTRTTRPSTTSSTPTSTARPGTEMTFFEYPGAAPRPRRRAAWCTRVVSRVALDRRRSTSGPTGSPPRASTTDRDGDRLRFADPEGLGHELAVDARRRAARRPSTREIPRRACARRASIGVRAYSLDAERSGRAARGRAGARRRAATNACELRGDAARRRRSPSTRRPRRGRPGSGLDPPRRLGHDRCRAPALARAPTRRPACRRRRSSTATSSTRSTSASPAGSSTRSPTTLPALRWAAAAGARWARPSSSRPG